jgi:hypothetical protein
MNRPIICIDSSESIAGLMIGIGKGIDHAFRRDRGTPKVPNPTVALVANPQEAWSGQVNVDIQPGDYLFTVGDHDPAGLDPSILASVQGKNPVFHISLGDGRNGSVYPKQVKERWEAMLGSKAIWLTDHKLLGEIVILTIRSHLANA